MAGLSDVIVTPFNTKVTFSTKVALHSIEPFNTPRIIYSPGVLKDNKPLA